MEIIKNQNGNALTIAIEGRLDTTTAPVLENEIKTALEGVADLTVDLAKLEYISSAGLRVVLSMQKQMNKQGSMVIKNVCADVMEVFEITGFADILTIE
ncbi:MAG: STAS domain-containing protein [Clostridia bacterium]|nr:STAS domain-containing protein [Clostridia bacterium]